MTGKPIYGETTVAGSYAAHTIVGNKRFFFHFVRCGHVVAHILPAVITANLLIPRLAEAWYAVTVRENNDIPLLSHKARAPAIGPELADGILRPALTIKYRGILLIRIEISRVEYPCEHLFAVSSGHHALFAAHIAQTAHNGIVFVGELIQLATLQCVQFGRFEERLYGTNEAIVRFVVGETDHIEHAFA